MATNPKKQTHPRIVVDEELDRKIGAAAGALNDAMFYSRNGAMCPAEIAQRLSALTEAVNRLYNDCEVGR